MYQEIIKKEKKKKINVIREFSNRLLVIDEVHNIRALQF